MRVLLFADANSFWNLNYINHVLIRDDVELIVFSENLTLDPPVFYAERGIDILSYSEEEKKIMRSPNRWKQRQVRNKFMDLIGKYGPFDVINVQFVRYYNTWMALRLAGNNTKVILSYWGSDLLRTPNYLLWRLKKLIKRANDITFDNIDLQKKFLDIYGRVFHGRQKCVYFGLPILDEIDALLEIKTKSEIKKEMGCEEGQIVIAVGYNGIEQQQHLEVLQAIDRLPQQLKGRIKVFLQMTYGGTVEYKECVISKAEKTVGSVSSFLQVLSDDEVAKIRIATDIYINAQTTDAFSGSVCENFYCGNLVCNAKWLIYEELKRYDINYIKFDDFLQLSRVLQEYLEGKTLISTFGNKAKIAKLRSWKYCKKNWNQMLFE